MDLTHAPGKRIVLGVCGGIAAYKVVELARELTQAGADVRVAMSESAQRFVGPITFSTLTGNPVATALFPDPVPAEIPHTSLGRSADVVVVAPATAKIIAKYALGVSDDLISAILLATRAPVVMAPAMHTEMWENEATQANVELLRQRGVSFVGPDEGALAGPDIGAGRLSETGSILQEIEHVLSRSRDLDGVRVLVTAGGTREPIDAVRYIGNRSSGRMGVALAEEAVRRGAKVTLVTGPTAVPVPSVAENLRVETAEQMRDEVLALSDASDVIVMAAAVSDWRPASAITSKMKKSEGAPEVRLVPTPDILSELSERRAQRQDGRVLVGFAAETGDLQALAAEKMASKPVDLLVANQVGVEGTGFESETNRAILLDRHGRLDELPLMSKRMLARVIIDTIVERFL